jgi:hypothetical protein
MAEHWLSVAAMIIAIDKKKQCAFGFPHGHPKSRGCICFYVC